MFRVLIISFFILSTVEATKRSSRTTGMKCLKCHQSRKGGNKNLRAQGKEYREYKSIKDHLRRSRLMPTKANLEKVLAGSEKERKLGLWNFWYGLEKEVRRQRLKKNVD